MSMYELDDKDAATLVQMYGTENGLSSGTEFLNRLADQVKPQVPETKISRAAVIAFLAEHVPSSGFDLNQVNTVAFKASYVVVSRRVDLPQGTGTKDQRYDYEWDDNSEEPR